MADECVRIEIYPPDAVESYLQLHIDELPDIRGRNMLKVKSVIEGGELKTLVAELSQDDG